MEKKIVEQKSKATIFLNGKKKNEVEVVARKIEPPVKKQEE